LWCLHKFGKKSLFTQGTFGFPFLSWINCHPPKKLLAPILTKIANL
jgi:hypothetical protein